MHRGRRRRVAVLAARLRALSPPEVVRLAEAAALIERVAREPV
jgi:hypothetical protein